MPHRTVLISGAGIAGPTLAYWLLRRGLTPTLIERAPKFREGGYIIDFWGIGFDVAEKMGLIPMLREAGYVIDRVEFVAEDGHQRSAMAANVFQRSLGDRFLSIKRGDLAHAIYRTVERETETIFGDSIAEIKPAADCVEVTFDQGPPRRFDLVVFIPRFALHCSEAMTRSRTISATTPLHFRPADIRSATSILI